MMPAMCAIFGHHHTPQPIATCPNACAPLGIPDEMGCCLLTTIRDKVVKIGVKVIAHARYAIFKMAEVAGPRYLFRHILDSRP